MFEDTDVIRVLEEILPQCFGGGATDYQLAEQLAADDLPRLNLLVHPRLGPVDPLRVAEVFLDAIGSGSETGRDMARQWGQAGLLQVERKAPQQTGSGKILHLTASATTRPGDST